MKLSTHLGRDRFAWMEPQLRRSDNAVLLVRATAEPAVEAPSSPLRLVVAFDRGPAMVVEHLERVKDELITLVRRLGPRDSFGLVVLDDAADVVVPVGPVDDVDAVVRRIRAIEPGDGADLLAGTGRALDEAARIGRAHGALLLVTAARPADLGDLEVLGGRVEAARAAGTTTSTIGVGLDHDELFLSSLSRSGGGEQHFVTSGDELAAALRHEAGGTVSRRHLACRLTFTPSSGIRSAEVLNDLPRTIRDEAFVVDLGDLDVGESRSVVVECAPRQATRPGRRRVGVVRLEHVDAHDGSEHSVSTTVWTNVIRPGEREGVTDRGVVGEWYVQRVLRRKREAARALARGDVAATRRWLAGVRDLARSAASDVGRAHRDELLRDADAAAALLAAGDHDVEPDRLSLVAKSMSVDVGRRARRRP